VKWLDERQRLLLKFWLPAIVAGGIAGLLYLGADTPPARSAGLALIIVGVALTLRRMGAVLAVIGSLTLAVCPAFWAQTGGGEGTPATIVIALVAAVGGLLLATVVSKRPVLGLGIGILVFTLFFWSQIGTPRSIRLTGFVVGWSMFLLTDLLFLTNPHADDDSPPPPILMSKNGDIAGVKPYHTWGLLLLIGIGILNDPLLLLLTPALMIALYLSNVRLSTPYWVMLSLIVGFGLRGIFVDYLDIQGYRIALNAWRDARRWIDLVEFVGTQFSIMGLLLGVLGLARLSRWYPPLGIVTMVAYGAYVFFGLVYRSPVWEPLLLPILIIQILWTTYAVFTLGEWARKSFGGHGYMLRWGILALYALLPAALMLNLG
jgi:hypothetical protein